MINWFGYFNSADGYGRFNARLAKALSRFAPVNIEHIGILDLPKGMLESKRIDWSNLTITCTPPYMVKKVWGRHWLYTMTEGSRIPASWVEAIHKSEVERVLVPCTHNLKAFRDSGVEVPISVVPGGTDPNEFPVQEHQYDYALEHYRPYTFLCFADRGDRKGFPEVWEAFYKAFGGKTTGEKDVGLIIKGRMKDRSLLSVMASAKDGDSRVIYQEMDAEDMNTIYAQADCLVLPSRSEGWGMIHREAACTGLPVITQAYSGLDDAKHWAEVVSDGEIKPIPNEVATALGEWRIVDTDALAGRMRYMYDWPHYGALVGRHAAQWIRREQTWEHSAKILLSLIGITNAFSMERTAV